MKEGIHPEYNEKVQVKCSCGNNFEVGSTASEIEVEVCSACHPFYTGKQKLVDVAGRIDKFKKRMEDATVAEKEQAEVDIKAAKKAKEEEDDQSDDTVKLG